MNRIALPNDPVLFKDLTAPMFDTKSGKIRVEPKESLRDRLGRSPDKGDALAYGNWVRRRTPLSQVTKVQSQEKNKDYSLERFINRHEKRQQREAKQFERMLRQRNKTRGRG